MTSSWKTTQAIFQISRQWVTRFTIEMPCKTRCKSGPKPIKVWINNRWHRYKWEGLLSICRIWMKLKRISTRYSEGTLQNSSNLSNRWYLKRVSCNLRVAFLWTISRITPSCLKRMKLNLKSKCRIREVHSCLSKPWVFSSKFRIMIWNNWLIRVMPTITSINCRHSLAKSIWLARPC